MKYPEYIEVNGERYALDTDYRTALRCLEIIEDESISDTERALAVIILLLGDVPHADLNKVQELLCRYLSMDNIGKSHAGKKDMDFVQDEGLIVASFMSDYNIDLSKGEPMHWWHFVTLVNGLTGDSALSKVREIRNTPLSDYKGKARERLRKAKESVALKRRFSEEDKEAMAKFDALLGNKLADDDELLEDTEV